MTAAAAVVVAAGLAAAECAAESNDPAVGAFGCPDEIGLRITMGDGTTGPDELDVAGEPRRAATPPPATAPRRSAGSGAVDRAPVDCGATFPESTMPESTTAGARPSFSSGDEPASMPVLGGGTAGEGPVTGARSPRMAPERAADGSLGSPSCADDSFEPDPVPDRDRRAEPRLTSRKSEAPVPVVVVDEKGDEDRRRDSARPGRGDDAASPRPPAVTDDEASGNPAWTFALRNISRLLDL